jgi:hypothetical protein
VQARLIISRHKGCFLKSNEPFLGDINGISRKARDPAAKVFVGNPNNKRLLDNATLATLLYLLRHPGSPKIIASPANITIPCL